jgi:hypothetical protein
VEAKDKITFADMISGVQTVGPALPKRPQPIHFYSQHWYEERVKARFEAVWEIEKQRAKDLGLDPPSELKIRNEVTRDTLKEESDEFKAEMQTELEAEHSTAIMAWELTRADAPTRTPEELNV